jgi:hypothetical protein
VFFRWATSAGRQSVIRQVEGSREFRRFADRRCTSDAMLMANVLSPGEKAAAWKLFKGTLQIRFALSESLAHTSHAPSTARRKVFVRSDDQATVSVGGKCTLLSKPEEIRR